MSAPHTSLEKPSAPLRLRTTWSRIDGKCRRAMEVMLAALGLLVMSPLMGLIAFLLWCESPGHVIFRQLRIGLHGKRFTLYKFRKFAESWGSEGPAVTVANDVRLTRLGAVLERTKLDELPQLYNVVKGDMGLVGLRPEMPQFADMFVGRYRALLDHLPGFFGPGLIRNECDLYPPDEDPEVFYCRVIFPWKAEQFLAYHESANLFSDLRYIVKDLCATIIGVVKWRRFLRLYGLLIVVDIVLIWLGWTVVNFFRYFGTPDMNSFVAGLWIFPVTFVSSAMLGGCYRYPRQHFSPSDGIRLVMVFSFAWMAGFLVLLGLDRGVSLYLMPMGWFMVCTLLVIGRTSFSIDTRKVNVHHQKRGAPGLLIYGFDEGAVALANWVKVSSPGMYLAGYLADDDEQIGQRVEGVPVLGSEKDLPTIIKVHKIAEMWMTFSPDYTKRRRIRTFCDRSDIKLVIIPELEPFQRFRCPFSEDDTSHLKVV